MNNYKFDSPTTTQSLISVFRRNVLISPDTVLYRFLDSTGQIDEEISYIQLDRAAQNIGRKLQQQRSSSKTVLILFPPSLNYIKALFACFYAGLTAVPTQPPTNNRNSPRIARIVADSRAEIVLTTKELYPKLSKLLDIRKWIIIDDIQQNHIITSESFSEPDETAFIQYTSSSTGLPKGVEITHANLYHNAKQVSKLFGLSNSSVCVSWLPLYHDMGLIGGVLIPILEGVPTTLMSHTSFVQRPFRWLKMISEFRATHSGGPNFSYELCIKHITEEQKKQLDLSNWEVAFNGAESIQAETIERFSKAFLSCGFRKQTFFPCYGLAEATLMVTGGDRKSEPVIKSCSIDGIEKNRADIKILSGSKTRSYVGCGHGLPELEVVIVNPKTREQRPDGQIGEIWVRGPSVAKGYWNDRKKTKETFLGRLDSNHAAYLRTEDLGFIANKELFVTGRLKDLIIINGRNIYPQDVEVCAQKSHPSIRPQGAAAFSTTTHGNEELVLLLELARHQQPNYLEVLNAVRQALGSELDVQPIEIVLVKPLNLVYTTSGKIRRNECKILYQNQELAFLTEWKRVRKESFQHLKKAPSQIDIKEWIVNQLCIKLNIPLGEINDDTSFSALGLSSIDALELTASLEDEMGFSVAPTTVWNYPNVDSLSGYLDARFKEKTKPYDSKKSCMDSVTDDNTLTSIQLGAMSDADLAVLLSDEIDASQKIKDNGDANE